jgi:alpha-L-rhamnosidase
VGWDEPGFDDHLWSAATVLGRAPVSPWTHLVPVRTRLVEAPVVAVALTRLPTGAYVADFGRVYAAVPTVTFHHGIPARLVVVRAGYLLDPSGDVSVLRGTQHTDMSYSYVQRGGQETFRPFDYLGFRYLEIQNPGEALSPGDVVALARHTAVPDEPLATFSSSDPGVDAVFALGRHSALFSAQEQFVDTPTREKGPWLWDGFNESQTEMAAFDELNLTRKDLLEFAQSQRRYWPQGPVNKIYPTGLGAQDIGEFTEVYAEWVWQYWFHTGDRPLLQAVYPVLSKLSDYLAQTIAPSSGLLPNLPATNVYSTLAVVTRQNVLGANVFRRAADAAHVLGLAGDESRDRQRQSALTAAINSRLTLPNGLYVDGIQPNGVKAATTQDANAVAAAYGLAPSGVVATLGAVMASEGLSVPPRTATEVLATLRMTGRDDDFVRRLTDTKSDGWANILAQGATFTWEVWHPSDNNGDSMSHGWGSNVLVEIQRELLGVSPTSPGFATFAVTPPHAGLAWAQGSVPTRRGGIGVSWQRPAAAGGAFSLDVTVPSNTTATLRLPAIGPDTVTEGGHPWRDLRLQGGDAVIVVGAGTYHFRSTPVPAGAAGVGVNGPGPSTGPRPAAPASAGGAFAPGSGQAPEPGLSAGRVAAGTPTADARGGGGHHVARGVEVAAAVGGLIALIAVARTARRRGRVA